MNANPTEQQPGSEPEAATLERPGSELIQLVYDELRRLAAARLRRMPVDAHTLQATALVHEAYLRLSRQRDRMWKGRRHFYNAAALAMRFILIERLRRKNAAHHGGWQQTEITVTLAGRRDPLSREDLLALDQVLTKLQRAYPDLAEIVLMRYFCGLTNKEIAKMCGVSTRQVERNWAFARAWLIHAMGHTRSVSSP